MQDAENLDARAFLAWVKSYSSFLEELHAVDQVQLGTPFSSC